MAVACLECCTYHNDSDLHMIPSPKVSGTVVQPYFAVLSFHQLVEIGTHACCWTARACTTSVSTHETHDSYKRKPEQFRVRFDYRGHQLHPFLRLRRYFKVGLPCRLRLKSEEVSVPTALHASIRLDNFQIVQVRRAPPGGSTGGLDWEARPRASPGGSTGEFDWGDRLGSLRCTNSTGLPGGLMQH